MRVLISSSSSFWISHEAVVLARAKGAKWAQAISLWDEEGFLGDTQKPDHFHMTEKEWRQHEEHYSLSEEVPRHDPHLLAVFDEIKGERMAGFGEGDRIEEIVLPDDIHYSIHSYCAEWVEERHRQWDSVDGEHFNSWKYFSKDSVFE